MNSKMKQLFALLVLTSLLACNSDSKKEESIKKNANIEELEVIVSKTSYEKAYEKAMALWQVPTQRMMIKTSFGKAHVIACGPEGGEVLVLLHGMNASSTMWYPNIKALSKTHRVYAIDFLIEPGRSEYKGTIETTDQVVKWYTEIFRELELDKYSLIGASRGGWLALSIALQEKRHVAKIALLSPAQTFSWIPPGQDLLQNIMFTAKPKRSNLRKVLETLSSDVNNIEDLFIEQHFLAMLETEFNKSFIEMTPFDEKDLQTIKVPVLVLIGDEDFINPAKNLEKAQNSFPNVETKMVSNAGHFLSIDQAKEVNKELLDFLKKK